MFATSPDGQMHVSEAALLRVSTAMPQATVLERRHVVLRLLTDNVSSDTIGEIDRLLDSGSPIPTLVIGQEGDIEVTNPVSPDDSVRVTTIQKASFELLAPALRIAFGEDIDPAAGAPVQWVELDANEMLVLLTPEQTVRVQARLDSVRAAAESSRWADERNRLDREARFLTPRAGMVVAPPELLSRMSLRLPDGFWPSRQGVVSNYETAAKKALGESSKPAAVIIRDALTTPRDGPDPNWRRPASAVVTVEEALPTLSDAWSLAAKWAGVLNAWLATPGQVESVVMRAANAQSDRIARQAWSTPPTPRSRSVGTNE